MRDLFVGTATKDAAQHLTLARREGTPGFRFAVIKFCRDATDSLSFVQLAGASHDLPDLLDQQLRTLMLQENPRAPALQQTASLELADARCNHQHFAGKSF